MVGVSNSTKCEAHLTVPSLWAPGREIGAEGEGWKRVGRR